VGTDGHDAAARFEPVRSTREDAPTHREGPLVHIARTTVIATPTDSRTWDEVVSPSELFNAANGRLDTALAKLGSQDEVWAPDSVTTLLAERDVVAGMRILHSAIVPTTPERQREAAITALGDVQAGLDLLDGYIGQIREMGPGPHPREQVQSEALHLLDTARRRITSATALLG
jgi:hypothetical protein